MTPAELKTIRETLGLPISWISKRFNVSARSAQYWESGERTVPDDVAEVLTRLDASFTAAAEQSALKAKDLGEQSLVILIRYKTDNDLWRFRPDMRGLPASAHAALLSRTRAALSRFGIEARIELLDVKAYGEWLKERGQNDSETNRCIWAARHLSA